MSVTNGDFNEADRQGASITVSHHGIVTAVCGINMLVRTFSLITHLHSNLVHTTSLCFCNLCKRQCNYCRQ